MDILSSLLSLVSLIYIFRCFLSLVSLPYTYFSILDLQYILCCLSTFFLIVCLLRLFSTYSHYIRTVHTVLLMLYSYHELQCSLMSGLPYGHMYTAQYGTACTVYRIIVQILMGFLHLQSSGSFVYIHKN